MSQLAFATWLTTAHNLLEIWCASSKSPLSINNYLPRKPFPTNSWFLFVYRGKFRKHPLCPSKRILKHSDPPAAGDLLKFLFHKHFPQPKSITSAVEKYPEQPLIGLHPPEFSSVAPGHLITGTVAWNVQVCDEPNGTIEFNCIICNVTAANKI